jgi:glycosyltransferase involved in cell wall biosynthesis
MKVLHVLINYHPSIGGTQLLYKGISENLITNYGDEVAVCVINSLYGSHSKEYKIIKQKSEIINGVIVKRFSFIRWHKPIIQLLLKAAFKLKMPTEKLKELYYGPIAPSLYKFIHTTNADVISASSTGYIFMNYAVYRHKLRNPKPFVYQGALHFNYETNDIRIPERVLNAINASEFYISNTEFEKNVLINNGVPADKVRVIGVATDIHFFENGNRFNYRNKYSLSDKDILIGYFGRIVETKKINILIDAFEIVAKNNKNLHLVIAGAQSSYAISLRNKVAKLNSDLSKRIYWEYNIAHHDKANFFHALDLFVLPSINESFGIVFLEAWACKKPVVGANIGSVASVITNEKDGLLFEPNNPNDLAQKITLITNNENLKVEMGLNGYKKVIENYSWEIITKKFRETYEDAIDKFNERYKK